MPRTHAKWLVVAVLLGLATLALVGSESLYSLVVTKTVPLDSAPGGPRYFSSRHEIRGWYRVYRWKPHVRHGRQEGWYVSTGMKAFEAQVEDGAFVGVTCWLPNGKVLSQERHIEGGIRFLNREQKMSPPWWWNMTDQHEPSTPFSLRD